MKTETVTPRVYAACLSSYNGGQLHGRWIDCDRGADHIRDEIADMLKQSPEPGAEEWAFHDSEYVGHISESEDIDRLAEVGSAVTNAGADWPAILAWLDGDMGRDPGDFADVFLGRWDSVADYVAGYYDSAYSDKEMGPLAQYIDWEAVGRDWELGGGIETARAKGGGVYIFRNE